MQFSNDGVTSSLPQTYAATKTWALTAGDGGNTVYVAFGDKAGNWSLPYSSNIVLDTTAPVDGFLTATTGSSQVTLNWTGFTDALSGIASYKLVYSTVSMPGSCSTGTLLYRAEPAHHLFIPDRSAEKPMIIASVPLIMQGTLHPEQRLLPNRSINFYFLNFPIYLQGSILYIRQLHKGTSMFSLFQ